jgi:hypothetical protein
MQKDAITTRTDVGTAQLLGHDGVESKVGNARSAELLGHGHPKESGLAALVEQVAMHDAGLLPLFDIWLHLPVHERAEAVPKDLVGVIEELAPHRILTPFLQGVPPLALAFVPSTAAA